MNEQISAIQTREVLELMRNLAPILNQKELFEFMLFSNRIVERYMSEHYNDGLSEEVTEVRKDIEWLRDEVSELYPSYDEVDYETVAKVQIIDEVLELIDQLDEFELTQEQVDKYLHERNLVAMDAMMIHETGMQNKVIIERPVIPQFVADYIEKWKYEGLIMHEWFTFDHDDEDEDKVSKWLYDNDYEENMKREHLLIDAIQYGYEVEKEPVYFAKIKGHELVETKTILDDDTGNDVSEFYRNVYFVLQRNRELVIDMKDNGLSGAKNVMTMNQWNDLGINESNADFEEVTE